MQVMNSINIAQAQGFGTAKLPPHIKKAHKLGREAVSSINKFDKYCDKSGKNIISAAKTIFKAALNFGKSMFYAGKAVVKEIASKIYEHKDYFKF